MPELRRLLGAAGYRNVVTYIQSGNVALDAAVASDMKLGEDVETLVAQHFGLSVPVIVRRHHELADVVAHNPFTDRLDQPAKIGVGFANTALPKQIALPAGSVDQLVVRGREVYLFCPNGFGRARLPDLDRVAHTPVTVRNWNTVLKLRSMTTRS